MSQEFDNFIDNVLNNANWRQAGVKITESKTPEGSKLNESVDEDEVIEESEEGEEHACPLCEGILDEEGVQIVAENLDSHFDSLVEALDEATDELAEEVLSEESHEDEGEEEDSEDEEDDDEDEEEEDDEEGDSNLVGNQHKLDKTGDGKLDKMDFKMLRNKKD